MMTYLRARKMVALCEVTLYSKYTHYGIMYTSSTCVYIWMQNFVYVFYMRDMTSHTVQVHVHVPVHMWLCGVPARYTGMFFTGAYMLFHLPSWHDSTVVTCDFLQW